MDQPLASVTISSQRTRTIKPLIEAALHHELDRIQLGIRQSEQRIQAFEQQYGMPSVEFLRQHQHDELPETLESIDWIGELQLLTRLREKETTLRELRFVD
jgi:hypothetical protein